MLHRWGNPAGGDIPPSEILHVGLEQDVWDWTVVSARVLHPDGTSTNAPLLGFHDWSNTVVTGTPAVAEATASAPGLSQSLDRGGRVEVYARGFRITASADSLVSDLMLADVRDLDLKLEDLNRQTLDELREKQLVEEVKEFGTKQLSRGKDFYIILKGGIGDLPEEIVAKGNFLLLNRPELLDRELLVYAGSRGEQQEGGEIGTFALLGVPPVIGERGPWRLGDYNFRGFVEANDLKIWEENFVPPSEHYNVYTLLTADGSQNLKIDGRDFLIWQREYDGPFPASEQQGIPEPSTVAIVTLLAALWASSRRGYGRTLV